MGLSDTFMIKRRLSTLKSTLLSLRRNLCQLTGFITQVLKLMLRLNILTDYLRSVSLPAINIKKNSGRVIPFTKIDAILKHNYYYWAPEFN